MIDRPKKDAVPAENVVVSIKVSVPISNAALSFVSS